MRALVILVPLVLSGLAHAAADPSDLARQIRAIDAEIGKTPAEKIDAIFGIRYEETEKQVARPDVASRYEAKDVHPGVKSVQLQSPYPAIREGLRFIAPAPSDV